MHERVLITGAAGFVGRHLAERLNRDDVTVVGLGRSAPPACVPHVAEFRTCDLTDRAEVERTIDALRPSAVYHLAARTVGTLAELQTTNVESLRNLSGALRSIAERDGRTIRMLVTGSAAELGSVGASRLPVREDAVCEPESDYGRSKLAGTRLALSEPTDSPLQIVVARTFNLVGPGLGTHLSLGRFAAQIAAVVRSNAFHVECGNLAARRDYIDVRDAVDTYARLLECGQVGELYNVCRGRSHAIRDLLHAMIERTGERISIVENRGPMRAGDLHDVYGDSTKTEHFCFPRTLLPIERSLADLVDTAMAAPDAVRHAA